MVNLTSEKNRKSSENDKICKYVNEIIRIINVFLDTQTLKIGSLSIMLFKFVKIVIMLDLIRNENIIILDFMMKNSIIFSNTSNRCKNLKMFE